MNPNTKVVKNPRFRARDCAIIIMTTFVLVGVFGLLCTALFSPVSEKPAGAAPRSLTPRKNADDAQPVAKGVKKSAGVLAEESRPAENARSPHWPTQAEVQEPPARPARAAASPHAQQPGFVLEPSFIRQTILTAAVIFALGIGAALVVVYCFFALLRRHSRDFGALIHVEHAGAQPMVVGPFTASSLGVALPVAVPMPLEGSNRGDKMSAETVAAHTAQASDFGGAFDAERQLMDAKAQRQEAAVLQQLFEDNLNLQAKISLAQGKQVAPASRAA